MTGIEPALSAWELACHERYDHEFAGQRHSGPCPLLTVLRRSSPIDRARSGHDTGPATGSFEQPLTRSFRDGWSAAAFLARAGFLVVLVPLDGCRFRLVLARDWHAWAHSSPGYKLAS